MSEKTKKPMYSVVIPIVTVMDEVRKVEIRRCGCNVRTIDMYNRVC